MWEWLSNSCWGFSLLFASLLSCIFNLAILVKWEILFPKYWLIVFGVWRLPCIAWSMSWSICFGQCFLAELICFLQQLYIFPLMIFPKPIIFRVGNTCSSNYFNLLQAIWGVWGTWFCTDRQPCHWNCTVFSASKMCFSSVFVNWVLFDCSFATLLDSTII